MVLNVHRNHKACQGRGEWGGGGGGGERVLRWGEREIIYLGSVGQSHKTVSTNHNLSEGKGEPKRY